MLMYAMAHHTWKEVATQEITLNNLKCITGIVAIDYNFLLPTSCQKYTNTNTFQHATHCNAGNAADQYRKLCLQISTSHISKAKMFEDDKVRLHKLL